MGYEEEKVCAACLRTPSELKIYAQFSKCFRIVGTIPRTTCGNQLLYAAAVFRSRPSEAKAQKTPKHGFPPADDFLIYGTLKKKCL